MNEANYIEWLKKHEETSGYKKFTRYINEIFEKNSFQKEIALIRKKYQIPDNGFKIGKNERYTFPPKKWGYDNKNDLFDDIKKLSEKYHIPIWDAVSIFEFYIFYNKKEIMTDVSGSNLCMISDLREESEEPFSNDTQKSDNQNFPIAIRISPYASQRDIIDFTKKLYSTFIKPLQEKYKEDSVPIGKLRLRNKRIKERNDFIYRNRNLPLKKIQQKLGEKYGANDILDEGHIGKIISIERKKRK